MREVQSSHPEKNRMVYVNMKSFSLSLVASCMLISSCAEVSAPDPREGFTERNVGKTLVTYVEQLGSQVVHMSDDGRLYLWSSAGPGTQKGSWRYDILATGAATTYQGAGGVNHPVQELETAWGICFRYEDESGKIVRRPNGGDWNCALFNDYESLIVDRASGDSFDLTRQSTRNPLPAGRKLSVEEIAAL